MRGRKLEKVHLCWEKMHTFVKENFDSSNLNDNISNETEI